MTAMVMVMVVAAAVTVTGGAKGDRRSPALAASVPVVILMNSIASLMALLASRILAEYHDGTMATLMGLRTTWVVVSVECGGRV